MKSLLNEDQYSSLTLDQLFQKLGSTVKLQEYIETLFNNVIRPQKIPFSLSKVKKSSSESKISNDEFKLVYTQDNGDFKSKIKIFFWNSDQSRNAKIAGINMRLEILDSRDKIKGAVQFPQRNIQPSDTAVEAKFIDLYMDCVGDALRYMKSDSGTRRYSGYY